MDASISSPSLYDTSADLSYNRATLYSALALGFRPPSQETRRAPPVSGGHRVSRLRRSYARRASYL